MAIEQDLKIFISWSGRLANEITKVLRDWLPKMFDHIDPWASETDIDAGSRGFDEIQSRLKESSFGIIVITTENCQRPWLNYEAGALSKQLDGDEKRVVPLLVGFDDANQLLLSPLHQFQRVKLDKEGVRALCKSIAKVIKLNTEVINHRFEAMWDELDTAVSEAKEAVGDQPEAPTLDDKRLLIGMYQAIQSLQKDVVALHNSGPVVVSPSPAYLTRTQSPHSLQIQDSIEAIASSFKPVRWVSLIERDGRRYIGVMFADGEGLATGDYNWFMEQVMRSQIHIPVTIETDR